MSHQVALAYSRTAERYIAAARHTGPHEAAGFDAYHALESICSAWLAQLGRTVPLGHKAKFNSFAVAARPYRFGRPTTAVVIAFQGLRNAFLYPAEAPGGTVTLPEQSVKPGDVVRLVGRVAGAVRTIQNEI